MVFFKYPIIIQAYLSLYICYLPPIRISWYIILLVYPPKIRPNRVKQMQSGSISRCFWFLRFEWFRSVILSSSKFQFFECRLMSSPFLGVVFVTMSRIPSYVAMLVLKIWVCLSKNKLQYQKNLHYVLSFPHGIHIYIYMCMYSHKRPC